MPQTREWAAQAEKIYLKLKAISLKNEMPDRLEIVAIHFDLDMLEYMTTLKLGWTQASPPKIKSPICSFPGCPAGWREGLINQALPGFDPVWFCTAHTPEYKANGVSPPPGSPIPRAPLMQKAKEMAKSWTAFDTKLTAEEAARKTSGNIEKL
jgi:hypothetical protein